MRNAVILLLLAPLAWGCGDNDQPLRLAEGCQPLLAGHHCGLPYPSDYFRVEDPDTATGWRIAPAGAARLETDQGASADVHGAGVHDGFSHIPTIVAVLPDEVSDAGLTRLTGDLAASLADDARTLLVAEDGTRVPHYVDLDPRAVAADRQAIVIHPAVALEPSTRYLVALRRIERPGGGTADPAEGFRRLRDGEAAGEPALEALVPHYEEAIFPLLEAQGWARDELQLAWDFTVGSQEAPVTDMLRVRELTLAWLADNQPVIEITEEVEDPQDGIWRRVRGTMTGPLFLTSDDPDGLLARDGAGQVELAGTATFRFRAVVPSSLRDATGPGMALAYGHGFFGNTGELEGSGARVIAGELGAVLLGIEWAGMSSDDLASVLLDLSGEPARAIEFADRVHQGMANWIVFASAIDLLANQPALQREGGEPLHDAAAPLGYLGISQGHILGGTMTALNPFIERIGLNVGGAGFTHMMFRARPFSSFLLLIDGALPDPLDQQMFVASLQVAFDRFDPASYARFLAVGGEPLPGVPAGRPLLIQAGLGDLSVPNLGTFLHARLLRVPYTVPSPAEPFGLEPVEPPVEGGGALTLWDFGVDVEAAYDVAEPPEADNEVHEGVRVAPTAIEQLRRLYEDGVIVHPCEGACDPG